MLVLKEKKDCTGCGACAAKCLKNAIVMKPDEEGFLYPDIQESICIRCNLCMKVCPQNGNNYVNNGVIGFWGGKIKDESILMKSSSGGAFSAICNVLDDDAIICGATYDEKLKVHHSWCVNGDGIDIFRKSKYLQSNVGNIYGEVKRFLNEGKTVLFSGTACQISGLYAYLGDKPDRLYTVDLICHGVPSQKVFDAYLRSLQKKEGMDICKFSFRDKSYFWGDWEIGTAFGNDKQWKHQAWGQDFYMSGFLRALFYRPVCYSCQYANSEIKRPADLTIGDFWGSKSVNPSYDDKKGSSLIVVNSEKGNALILKMQEIMELTLVDRERAVKENHNLIEPTKENQKREEFFQRLNQGQDFLDIMKDYRKGKSHSQKIRVLVTKIAPWIVERKRRKVRQERQSRI